jgi:hypothetical protein
LKTKPYMYIDRPWPEIIENYFCGMSQRELERRYDITARSLQIYVKYIMGEMITDPSSILRSYWSDISKDIVTIINNLSKGVSDEQQCSRLNGQENRGNGE